MNDRFYTAHVTPECRHRYLAASMQLHYERRAKYARWVLDMAAGALFGIIVLLIGGAL